MLNINILSNTYEFLLQMIIISCNNNYYDKVSINIYINGSVIL